VEVYTIASPRFNPHFIEPKPTDVLRVKKADFFVHAGLDLEAWRGPLLDAAGNREVMPQGSRQVDLSQGIPLLEVPDHSVSRAEGDIHLYGNPHYWVDPENVKIMAQTLCNGLASVDPAHEADYRAHLKEFLSRLDAKIPAWRSQLAPYAGQELIGYHNEWPYLMRFTRLKMSQYLEPKPGIPPTPKQIEFLQQYIPAHQVRAIAQSAYFPTDAADALARRTGVKIVLLCQSVHEVPEASDVIALFDYNVKQLVRVLGSGS